MSKTLKKSRKREERKERKMGNKNRENPKFSIKGKMKALIFSSFEVGIWRNVVVSLERLDYSSSAFTCTDHIQPYGTGLYVCTETLCSYQVPVQQVEITEPCWERQRCSSPTTTPCTAHLVATGTWLEGTTETRVCNIISKLAHRHRQARQGLHPHEQG